jgi:hypothetical protein
MERHPIPSVAAPRLPYAPPTATFVPLKVEEKLLACLKTAPTLQVSCGAAPAQS